MLDSVTMEIESNESIDACEVGAAKDRDSNNRNSGLVPIYPQGHSQDFEIGCPNAPKWVIKIWGTKYFEGDHNDFEIQLQACICILGNVLNL